MLMPNFGKLMNEKVKKLYERQDETMNPLFLLGKSVYRKKMKALENEEDLPDDATLTHEEVCRTNYRWISELPRVH